MLNKYSKYVELNEDYITNEPTESYTSYTLTPTNYPVKITNKDSNNDNNTNNEVILIIFFSTLSLFLIVYILYYNLIYRKKNKKPSQEQDFGTEFTLDDI
jgi:cbb3-type cytochrome oxidase subunit 3